MSDEAKKAKPAAPRDVAKTRLERQIAAEWPQGGFTVELRDYRRKLAVVCPDGDELALLPVHGMTPAIKKQKAFEAIRRWLQSHPAE